VTQVAMHHFVLSLIVS